ncbi:hypothetical protein HDK77DRAFT_478208 [Phyllosticta capitalensis]
MFVVDGRFRHEFGSPIETFEDREEAGFWINHPGKPLFLEGASRKGHILLNRYPKFRYSRLDINFEDKIYCEDYFTSKNNDVFEEVTDSPQNLIEGPSSAVHELEHDIIFILLDFQFPKSLNDHWYPVHCLCIGQYIKPDTHQPIRGRKRSQQCLIVKRPPTTQRIVTWIWNEIEGTSPPQEKHYIDLEVEDTPVFAVQPDSYGKAGLTLFTLSQPLNPPVPFPARETPTSKEIFEETKTAMEPSKSEDIYKETKTAKVDDSHEFNEAEVKRLSNYLSTRVIEIVVGVSHKRTFYIHEGLLCYASEKFKIQLRGYFKEAQTGKIPDCQEDPELFAVFADFLYHDGWLRKRKSLYYSCEWVMVSRCYAMGERLGSKVFQRECLWKLQHSITLKKFTIANDALCRILKATTELPERTTGNEDPLRALVLRYAAGQISTLRKDPAFKELLDEHPELGCQILMRVTDDESDCQPSGAPPEKRFEDKVEFL